MADNEYQAISKFRNAISCHTLCPEAKLTIFVFKSLNQILIAYTTQCFRLILSVPAFLSHFLFILNETLRSSNQNSPADIVEVKIAVILSHKIKNDNKYRSRVFRKQVRKLLHVLTVAIERWLAQNKFTDQNKKLQHKCSHSEPHKKFPT